MMSCLLITSTGFLCWLKNVVITKHFIKQNSKISITAVQNLASFLTSVPLIVIFIHMISNGLKYKFIDFVYGTMSGIITLAVCFLAMNAVIKGKPGAADALIETSTILVIILDSVLFLRTPTILQVFCILLSFCATVIIVMTNRKQQLTDGQR